MPDVGYPDTRVARVGAPALDMVSLGRVGQAARRRTIDPAMYVSMARMAPRSLSRQIRDSWLSMVVVIRCGYILAPC